MNISATNFVKYNTDKVGLGIAHLSGSYATLISMSGFNKALMTQIVSGIHSCVPLVTERGITEGHAVAETDLKEEVATVEAVEGWLGKVTGLVKEYRTHGKARYPKKASIYLPHGA